MHSARLFDLARILAHRARRVAARGVTPVLLLSVLALAAGCAPEAGGDAATAAPAVPVTVATVATRDVPVQIRAIGNVEASSTVSIKPQVDGLLAALHFREGDAVTKGQLLLTIDPRPFEAALRQAEANLARDEAEASNARVEADRLQRLFDQGFVSRDEFDRGQTRAASSQAVVAADQAAVEQAKLLLQYCYVRAPIDGRVGQILVHEGNVVKKNETTLVVINTIHPVLVAFSVPEHDLPAIRTRAAAGPLAVEALVPGGAPVTGTLNFIDNAVDTTTGTVRLKGAFANDDEALWPGQFVDVALTLSVQRGAVVVPAEAIQTGQNGSYVFVVTPELTAEVRPVAVGRMDGAAAVVAEGLTPGERVVTEGQIRLAPGAAVAIKDGTGAPLGAARPTR